MKKSILKFIDVIKICLICCLCFSINFIINVFSTIKFNSYLLESFIGDIVVHRTTISLFMIFLVLVYFYQLINCKIVEVKCRILVGDTIYGILERYFIFSLCSILVGYAIFWLLEMITGFSHIYNLSVLLILILYDLLSMVMVIINEKR